MKALVVLALLVSASAHADVKGNVIRSVPKAGAAAKGGAAALKVGTAAKVGADNIRAVVAAIHQRNTPAEAAVAGFRDYVSKVQGIDGRKADVLVDGFRTTVVDKGCIDANLSGDAYNNLSTTIDSVVSANVRAQTSVAGLADMAKNSDLNGDGTVSAEEAQLSDEADKTLTTQAGELITSYSKALKKTPAEAVAGLTNLSNRCGLAPAYAARFATASAAR